MTLDVLQHYFMLSSVQDPGSEVLLELVSLLRSKLVKSMMCCGGQIWVSNRHHQQSFRVVGGEVCIELGGGYAAIL